MSESKNPITKHNKQRRLRISDEMRECVRIMVEEGLPLPMAAEKANITRCTAVKAIQRPHVKALHNQMLKDLKDNAAQQAYLRINSLSITADSERLKYDANRWVAGVDGISPVTKVEGRHHHSHSFGGFDYPDLDPIDVTPTTQDVVPDGDE